MGAILKCDTLQRWYMLVICKWRWPSFEKVIQIYFWFIKDLWYSFFNDGEPSFRNESRTILSEWWGDFDMTSPAFSFRKQGGFTSCHNEREYHFFYHLKQMGKLPKFYHSETFFIFQRLLMDNHFGTKIAFFIEFSAI